MWPQLWPHTVDTGGPENQLVSSAPPNLLPNPPLPHPLSPPPPILRGLWEASHNYYGAPPAKYCTVAESELLLFTGGNIIQKRFPEYNSQILFAQTISESICTHSYSRTEPFKGTMSMFQTKRRNKTLADSQWCSQYSRAQNFSGQRWVSSSILNTLSFKIISVADCS